MSKNLERNESLKPHLDWKRISDQLQIATPTEKALVALETSMIANTHSPQLLMWAFYGFVYF